MTYYINNGEFYYDFPFLLGVTQITRKRLHFILNYEEIGRINYKGNYIYKLEDLHKSPVLSEYVKVNVVEVSAETE